MKPSPASQHSAFLPTGADPRQQLLGQLQRQLLELSLAHEQVKVALLEKQLQGLYHYLAVQQMWQPLGPKPFHRVSSSDTLSSGDCEAEESRSGQEAGYPTKVTGLPWTQAETRQSPKVFRLETCLRRELCDAVPCTAVERKMKVHRYLLKMRTIKAKKVYSRVFVGRSETAKCKTRVNGRFVKTEAQSPTSTSPQALINPQRL